MLKRSILISLFALLAIASLTACKTGLSAPVGSKDDYTEIDTKSAEYEISKGMGYHLKLPIPTTRYYQGETQPRYRFTAKDGVKIYYKEKLRYSTISKVTLNAQDETDNSFSFYNLKENKGISGSDNLDTEFELKAGDNFYVDISLYKYDTEGGTAAEFYVWAE